MIFFSAFVRRPSTAEKEGGEKRVAEAARARRRRAVRVSAPFISAAGAQIVHPEGRTVLTGRALARWRATPTQRSTETIVQHLCLSVSTAHVFCVLCVCVCVCDPQTARHTRHTYSMGIPGFNVHSNLDFAFAAVAL